MSNLMQITQEIIAFENQLIENEGLITEEIQNSLAINEKNLAEKIDKYAYLIDRLERGIEYFKMKEEEAYKLKKNYERTIESLKDTLKFTMNILDTKELKGGEYSYKLVKSKPKVVIDNEDFLSMEYTIKTITYKADKEKIFNTLEKGGHIDGVKLEDSYSLRKIITKN